MADLVVRALEPGDLEGVAVMCHAVFGTGHGAEHYRWKYFGNPGGAPLTTLALSGQRPVGIMGAIPVRVCIAGVETQFVQELDVGVDESHRGLKTFLRMAARTSELYRGSQAAFCYGMGNEFSAGVGMTMFGRRKVSSAPRLARVLDWRSFLKRKPGLRPVAGALGAVASLATRPRRPSAPRGYALREIRAFDGRFDDLWAGVKGDYPVMIARTSGYLSWRYGDPGRSYTTVCVEEERTSRVLGFVVTAVRPAQGLSRATIVDIVTPRHGPEWVPRLLVAEALWRLARQQAAVVECWMFPHAHLTPVLKRTGFVPRRAGVMDLTFGPIARQGAPDGAATILADPANWYLTAGDTDWV